MNSQQNNVGENPTGENYSHLGRAKRQASIVLEIFRKLKKSVEELFDTAHTIGLERLLKAYDNEVRLSMVLIMISTLIVVSVVELFVSIPIYAELTQSFTFAWIIALMFLLLAGIISHGFCRYLSVELNIHYFNEKLRGSPEVSISELRASYENDKKKSAIISLVMLLGCCLCLFFLSIQRSQMQSQNEMLRTEQEQMMSDSTGVISMPSNALADTTQQSNPSEVIPNDNSSVNTMPEQSNVISWIDVWLPLFLFILNATYLGIFVHFFYKRWILKRNIKRLEIEIDTKQESIRHHLQLFARYFELAKKEEGFDSNELDAEIKAGEKLHKEYLAGDLKFTLI